MPRKSSSQWDFGELFPPQATRRVLSVAELTTRIKGILEKQVGDAWVAGEISNLRAQASGHIYFTLKDASAQISCVLFRGVTVPDRRALRDGQQVVLQGDVTVYEPRGQYQMVVRAVELQGVGALQQAFERLKQRLQAEGLFDPARKRPIPRYPERVGLVTSPTGAAIRDVLHVIGRRHPGLELLLVPCRVQGQGAEREMAEALARLNEWSAARPGAGLEVILLTRGGGSLEDLWAFNEEVLARAIAASAIPVISAVGHEIDFTIADFVADLRAATPSAAAEILTAGYVEARESLRRLVQRWARQASLEMEARVAQVEDLRRRLARAHPRRRLNEQGQRLDDRMETLHRVAWDAVGEARRRLSESALRLAVHAPRPAVVRAREALQVRARALTEVGAERVRRLRERVERLSLRLEMLSPEAVLARGYSITRDEATGRVLRTAADVTEGMRLRTRLASGEVSSVAALRDPGEGAV